MFENSVRKKPQLASGAKNKRREKKIPRVPTAESLARSALHYLEKFAASESSLRRVLENRVKRATMFHPDFAANHAAQENLREAIEKIIATHKRTGIINDADFAAMKVSSLRRGGRSARAIRQRLAHKGVAAALIEKALTPEDDTRSIADDDLRAAQQFAKKKRIGPYRAARVSEKNQDEDFVRKQQQKDFAALARAGFAYDISRQVLNATVEDYLDE